MPASILVCSAVPDEIALIRAEMGAGPRVEFLTLGVGNVAAALSLQQSILQNKHSEIILVGSAGIYDTFAMSPSPAAVGDVVASVTFCAREIAVLLSQAKIPPSMEECVTSELGPSAQTMSSSLGITFGTTNCPDSVTLCTLEKAPADFENMEAFGAASAARRHNVPFSAFFAVTNIVGPAGSDQWRKNHAAVGRKLEDLLLPFLIHLRK